MSVPRKIIVEYTEASEKLLNLKDLTDTEMEVVQEMIDQLTEMLDSQR